MTSCLNYNCSSQFTICELEYGDDNLIYEYVSIMSEHTCVFFWLTL